MGLEKRSNMTSICEKLAGIGGIGPLKAREWRIKCRLGWHDKASSTVRHMLYGERRPTAEEAKEIEAGHLKYCAEKVRANAVENALLIREMRSALEWMESTDPEFYGEQLEAVRSLLLQRRKQAGESGPEG